MQVRYQAALHPECRDENPTTKWRKREGAASAAQHLQQVFQLQQHLADDLLSLGEVFLGLFARKTLARAANGKPLLIEQGADLTDQHDVMPLVIAAVAAPLDGLKLWKLLFPVAQDMWLDRAKLAHFSNSEVTLGRDRRQLVIVRRFQHKLPRAPLVFGPGGRSPRAVRKWGFPRRSWGFCLAVGSCHADRSCRSRIV